jgi:hypothetical protein
MLSARLRMRLMRWLRFVGCHNGPDVGPRNIAPSTLPLSGGAIQRILGITKRVSFGRCRRLLVYAVGTWR